MSWTDVYVCKKCGKVYNKLAFELPKVCKKCGANMRTIFGPDWGNVSHVAARRKLFGWDVPALNRADEDAN